MAVACTTAAFSAAFSMEYRLVGKTIYATGAVADGDATKLQKLIQDNDVGSGFDDYAIRLNSPGGLTLEGMKIGRALRAARIQTLVAQGDSCASACALVFLGGTSRYATGIGIGRRLAFGAHLGFHGFRAPDDSVRFENETLSLGRIVAALILEYAAEMKGVDLGWLAASLNVAPEDLTYVTRPADFRALSIVLDAMPNNAPPDWFLNACRLVVKSRLPVLDDVNRRVTSRSAVIPTIKSLREILVTGRFGVQASSAAPVRLSDSDAIDLALGAPFHLNDRKPILDARSVGLERGGGFYYDKCVAIRTRQGIAVFLIDEAGSFDLPHFEFHGQDAKLAMYDDNTPLW
jgi:hypothetical protein